jgi:hypothetical protein
MSAAAAQLLKLPYDIEIEVEAPCALMSMWGSPQS